MADNEDADREQRVQAHARAAESLDPELQKPARGKRTKAPVHPAVERAQDQIGDLIDDLHEVERTLEREPTVAALVVLIRRRLRDVWSDLASSEPELPKS